MPWKDFLPGTAGTRKSRRYSILEKTDPPIQEGHDKATSVDSIARQVYGADHHSVSHLSCSTPYRDPTSLAQNISDSDLAREDIPQRLRNGNSATIPKSNRFSLLRFRHASDPQLSTSYNTSATSSIVPPPLPTSKSFTSSQPDVTGADSELLSKHLRS
jgi:hypothetical protein